MESITYSSAAQIIIALIPVVGIVIGGQVVFFYLLWRHKQVTLLIKSGMYTPVKFDVKLFSALAGILLTGIGIVLTIFFALLDGVSYMLLGGLIPGTLGAGLLAFHRMYAEQKPAK